MVEDLARIYRLVERTPLSAAPQPHHPLPHLDAIANNNGTTLHHQKSKHRPPTGIPKGEKKKARPKWCMDLFGRVFGGSPNLGGAGPFFSLTESGARTNPPCSNANQLGSSSPSQPVIRRKLCPQPTQFREIRAPTNNIAIPNLSPHIPQRCAQ